MLKEKVLDALNDQLNYELYSAYIYLAMGAYLEDMNLPGMSNWMKAQAQEEVMHAMKFYDYINNRHARVKLAQIDDPGFEWDSPLDAFETAFKHEQKVSDRIHKLLDLARDESDHPTQSFLQWFVDEQVEEESSVDDIVQKLKLAGTQGPGLLIVDQELAGRQPGADGSE